MRVDWIKLMIAAALLAYLIDVLMRRLSEGLEVQGIEVDRAGRTEEEQVGQEDEAPEDYVACTE